MQEEGRLIYLRGGRQWGELVTKAVKTDLVKRVRGPLRPLAIARLTLMICDAVRIVATGNEHTRNTTMEDVLSRAIQNGLETHRPSARRPRLQPPSGSQTFLLPC